MDVYAVLIKACGAAVLVALCLGAVGSVLGSYAIVLRLGATLLVFGVLSYVLSDVVGRIEAMIPSFDDGGLAYSAFSAMLKALGIAYVGRFCADICRDCGEQTIANAVEGVGRVCIFALSLPLLTEILGFASQVLSIGRGA